ncbi:MAG: hypothetical protein AMS25_18655 [Gemmatimonas sp. SM23_52]|nr:MAG: hypothetical protein AMS25_18655 [Gemmatimonas sp. SM23_52]
MTARTRLWTIALAALALHACGSPTGSADSPWLDREEDLANGMGALAGTVYFVGLPCRLISPSRPPCDGPYPDYEVVVYESDGVTEAARTRSDERGRYFVALEPGDYVIFTPAGLAARFRNPNTATVLAGKLTRLDLVVDTGIR